MSASQDKDGVCVGKPGKKKKIENTTRNSQGSKKTSKFYKFYKLDDVLQKMLDKTSG